IETIPGYICTNIGGDRPVESDAGLNVSLGENCILCMSQNDLQVFIRRSSAPPNVKTAPFLRRDPELKRNIIVTLALVALFLLVTTLFEVDNELEKEKAPERIATILYKKPAVTKAVAKTKKRNKKIVQKSSKKKNQVSKKSKKASKIKTRVNKKKTKAKVKVAGLKSSNKIKKVKKATPRKGKINKKLQVVRKKSKSSGANSTRKTVSKRRSNIKNAKGSVDTYKSVNFKSTISNLMAKGGSTKSLQVVKDTVEDAGDTSVTGSESATLKRAKVSQNIGSLSGSASGTLDSKKGVSGLVDKKSIYTAGLPFKTVILGGMDPDTIRKILIDHIPQFRYCYQKVLDRAKKEFQGIVKLDFVIGASGHVTKAAADSVEQMPFEVQGCVVNVLKGIRFPEPLGGGIVEVTQPMNFYPKLK
ncbi:MAG: AgmX/PglI C-terminal domain-containing protein, partial [Bdellovibrionales bacterium]|nr:AgmX/PglI C-terminal domain-containing protein [Bdellovibrionales bacterium]